MKTCSSERFCKTLCFGDFRREMKDWRKRIDIMFTKVTFSLGISHVSLDGVHFKDK